MTDESEARLGGKEGELQVELLTRDVLIRINVQASLKFSQTLENLERLTLMKGGSTGNGNGFVACGQEAPAVGTAFGNVERLTGFQMLQNLQIVDVAF